MGSNGSRISYFEIAQARLLDGNNSRIGNIFKLASKDKFYENFFISLYMVPCIVNLW